LIQREPEENPAIELVGKLVDHDCLSKVMKLYLKRYYVDGYNCVEIAEEFSISKQAVSEGIRRGISRLKNVLKVD